MIEQHEIVCKVMYSGVSRLNILGQSCMLSLLLDECVPCGALFFRGSLSISIGQDSNMKGQYTLCKLIYFMVSFYHHLGYFCICFFRFWMSVFHALFAQFCICFFRFWMSVFHCNCQLKPKSFGTSFGPRSDLVRDQPLFGLFLVCFVDCFCLPCP